MPRSEETKGRRERGKGRERGRGKGKGRMGARLRRRKRETEQEAKNSDVESTDIAKQTTVKGWKTYSTY